MPPTIRRIRLTVCDTVITGVLEIDRAPAKCAAFLKILPLHGKLLQARWSGETVD